MTENQEPAAASSTYKKQIRIAMFFVFIIEFIVLVVFVYKMLR